MGAIPGLVLRWSSGESLHEIDVVSNVNIVTQFCESAIGKRGKYDSLSKTAYCIRFAQCVSTVTTAAEGSVTTYHVWRDWQIVNWH